ncbi:hypothetical protein Sru01_69910 [Sphaerisporangium rufum]|uniref:Uncharacterized protein n=1 Tax=Sphaerisporangium rufum TaxID=1381558 RepID=A0A919R9R8_9ACTN|nr:hypothetical protein Sru01_69910 [Sphaerisporangium rufum]
MTVCPAAETFAGDADLFNAIPGADSMVTVADDGGEFTGGPIGGVPVATAVFRIAPLSTSAWVVT